MSPTLEDSKKSADKNGKSMGIISRPNASPGYWLCCLLPAALVTTANWQTNCTIKNSHYKELTVAAVGMLMQSLNFFVCLAIDAGQWMKLFFAISPGVITLFLLQYFTSASYGVCLALGFGSTLGYQYAYVRIVRGFPKSCSLGEATILVQGLVLFIINCVFQIPSYYESPPSGEMEEVGAIMTGALFCLLVISWMISTFKVARNAVVFYPLLGVLVIAVCVIPVTKDLPIMTVVQFIYSDLRRVFIVIFYMAMAAFTAYAVRWQLGSSEQASTRVRKIFHVLIVLVYIPGLIFQCTFLYLGSGVALAAFSVLDLIRMLKVPPFAQILQDAFATLHDEKDAGKIALTPFCLLIGCSLPLWIHPCPCTRSDSAAGENMLPMLAGILSVGIGDTAASVFGSKFGKHKWGDMNRSVEGSAAFVIAQLLVIVPLYFFEMIPMDGYSVFVVGVAVVLTAAVEALTDQIDNLVLPLIFYIVNFKMNWDLKISSLKEASKVLSAVRGKKKALSSIFEICV